MRLWVDQLESHREEARELLERTPGLGALALGADPVDRAQAMRSSFDPSLHEDVRHEAAAAMTIPGPAHELPVLIARPDGLYA